MPMKIHENILVFYRKLPTYNPQKSSGHSPYSRPPQSFSTNYGKQRPYDCNNTDGTRYPTDVIKFGSLATTNEPRYHPTQKPVKLLEYLIQTYTNSGETVLDSYMGSGSTGVACVNKGRNFIGIEKDDECFHIAEQRIACDMIKQR